MTDDLLRALGRAQRAELDDGPAAREPDDIGRPFEGREREELLDALFERLDAGEPVAAAQPEPGPANPGEADDGRARPSNVVPLASRRRGLWIGAVMALAAAAAAIVWWIAPGREQPQLIASVPPYAFTQLDGGQAKTRSDPGEPVAELELRASSTIDWVLTPAEPTTTPVAVALLAEASDGQRSFVDELDAEVTRSGAIRLRGPLNRWVQLSPGAWTLTLIVASSTQLPDSADAAAEPGAWRALPVRVTIVGE